MALNPRTRDARRTLVALVVLILAVAGFIGIAHYVTRDDTGPGQALLHPKLGLDLEGGTEMVLTPVLQGDAQVNEGQLEQAVNIIRQRINANGVAETEITTLGGRNVVISIPGQPTKEQLDAVSKPTQLSFRAVLAIGSGIPLTVPPTGTATPAPTATGTAPAKTTTKPASATATPTTPAATPKTAANAPVPPGLVAATTAPATGTAKPTAKPTATPAAPTTPAPVASTIEVQGQQWTPGTPLVAGMVPTPTSTAAPTDGSDVNWVNASVIKAYNDLDCSKQGAVDNLVDDPAKPFVTCSDDGGVKYILGPVEVFGKDIADATSGFKPGPNGQPTSEVEVNLKFDSEGAKAFAAVSKRLLSFGTGDTTSAPTATRDVRNQFGIVLDKYVISAPSMNALIPNGEASITGNFTLDSGKALAQQLKFGALPMSFTLKSQDSITPTLGGEQLRIGLLAGLVGFLMVIIYSLFQYRALGFVTVVSLVVAAVLTYLAVTLLGFATNYRLTMAGVTGLIVAIGVTADSFIVYFERIRDEVRDGRSLVAAVETGWKRARRTIFAADFVNFLAAAVLYLLASDKVRGFAFTLGLTTIIDLVVVVLFTHPVVSILAHSKFFGGGHRWSGLDPERLGADPKFRYAGRGRFVMPEPEPDPDSEPREPRRASNYPGADAEGAVL